MHNFFWIHGLYWKYCFDHLLTEISQLVILKIILSYSIEPALHKDYNLAETISCSFPLLKR